jgi:hypothetical protein
VGTELLRLRCRGHPAIRATHTKTLEFAVDSDITGRATCVLGVAGVAVGTPPPALAGWLRITVTARGESARIRALANSSWRPGGTAIVRRSQERLPTTMATDADLAAADLQRSLAAALTDPDSVVEVVVERDDHDEHCLVRYRARGEGDDRLAAECAAADAVVAEDAGARRLIVAHGAIPSHELPATGRVLVVSTTGVTSAPVRTALAERPRVEVLGLPPEAAVAWASPHTAPVLTAVGFGRRDALRIAERHRDSIVVFRCAARELDRDLDHAMHAFGTRTAAVTSVKASSCERPRWGPVADLRGFGGSSDVLCALDPVEDLPDEATADIAPAPMLTALLADGVSAKSLAGALATMPGWSRKRAYDFVLGLERPG